MTVADLCNPFLTAKLRQREAGELSTRSLGEYKQTTDMLVTAFGNAMATYGIKDLCERFAVGERTVLGWIRRRELRAIDVSRKGGGRPKWRITREALDAFELARTPPLPSARTRRRKCPSGVIEFYR